MDSKQIGQVLVVLGGVVMVVGLAVLVGWSLPRGMRLGRLPGDITFRRGNGSFTLLLGTSILTSAILTLILSLWRR